MRSSRPLSSRRAFLAGAFGVALGCRRRQASDASFPPAANARKSARVNVGAGALGSLRDERITAAALSPSRRRLATSSHHSTDSDWPGHVVVWDVEDGTPVSIFHGSAIGWSWGDDLLAWAPGGERLAATTDTNAIVVLEHGKSVCTIALDATRDSPTHACWIDDARLFVGAVGPGTGAVAGVFPGAFVISNQASDPLREWNEAAHRYAPTTKARWIDGKVRPERVRWNASIGAVVGDDLRTMVAVDVATGAPRYTTSLAAVLPKPTIATCCAWSDDGRRMAVSCPGGVALFDGDNGRWMSTVGVADDVRRLAWRGSRLVIETRSQTLLVVGDRLLRTFDEPTASCDWSPDGQAVSLLRTDGALRIVDAATGAVRETIHTGALEAEAELLWATPERLVVVAEEGAISIWSPRGRAIARFRTTKV